MVFVPSPSSLRTVLTSLSAQAAIRVLDNILQWKIPINQTKKNTTRFVVRVWIPPNKPTFVRGRSYQYVYDLDLEHRLKINWRYAERKRFLKGTENSNEYESVAIASHIYYIDFIIMSIFLPSSSLSSSSYSLSAGKKCYVQLIVRSLNI